MSSKSRSKLRLRVIKTIEENHLLDGVKSVLLGFSGGVDSAVLFDVLLTLRKKYSFTLYAAHVNHMIRGKESDRDEDFVRLVCEKAGIRLFTKRVDIPRISKECGVSLETAARDERYAFFYECTFQNKIDVVATAHNACDNTETVLFNLVRGTYVKGLAGIPYKRGNIIRPLRDCERSQICEYALRYGVSYVTDSTNLVDDCSRNILRLNVIPQLRRINPSLDNVVLNESKLFSGLNEILESSVPEAGADLSGSPDHIIAASVIEKCGFLNRELLERIVSAVKNKKDSSFTLPERKILRTHGGSFDICDPAVCERKKIEYTVLSEGKNILAEGVSATLSFVENFNEIYKYTTTFAFIFDNIKSVISVRSRREGDRITVRGTTKSVKKEFINKKIPRELRDLIPVILIDGKIAAVPYIGADDAFYAKDPSKAGAFLGIELPRAK